MLAIIILTMQAVLATPVFADPPLPERLPRTGDCYFDNIFYGAVPPLGEANPVLVFVHGYGGLASDWWVDVPSILVNDMYKLAYEAGYRTAFVNLNVDPDALACVVRRKPAKSVMNNGAVLSQQLGIITAYYGVDQVDIITHSKGGIDAQAAIVWWGGHDKVRNVFTLSTPHQGSLLADLVWGPFGGVIGDLLELFGQDDATYSIQTAEMQIFRQATDISPLDDHINYYSGAGTGWRGSGGLTELAGWILQNWDHELAGDNDGVITVRSTYLPGATTLFIEPWDHTEVYLGQNAFPYIQQVLPSASILKVYLPLILTGTTAGNQPAFSPPNQAIAAQKAAADDLKTLESRYILRAGRLTDSVTEIIPIEPQARTVSFKLLVGDRSVIASLYEPDGSRHPFQVVPDDCQEPPVSKLRLEYNDAKPKPGRWTVRLDGPAGTAYLLVVTLDSRLRVGLNGMPNRPILPGTPIELAAWARTEAEAGLENQLEMRVSRSKSGQSGAGQIIRAGSVLSHTFTQEGTYGILMTVSGQTTDGLLFERSFVHSLAVASAGDFMDKPYFEPY